VEEEVLRRDAADTEVNRPVRERNMKQKAGVKWPRANSSKKWEAVNGDLSIILGKLGRNASNRLEKIAQWGNWVILMIQVVMFKILFTYFPQSKSISLTSHVLPAEESRLYLPLDHVSQNSTSHFLCRPTA